MWLCLRMEELWYYAEWEEKDRRDKWYEPNYHDLTIRIDKFGVRDAMLESRWRWTHKISK